MTSILLELALWTASLLSHALTGIRAAGMVAMTSRSHVLVLNAGQALTVDCTFQADEFNLFDNPVLWKKSQRDEETQLNIMGNLFEPFLTAGRFELTFEMAEAPKYCLSLKITGGKIFYISYFFLPRM